MKGKVFTAQEVEAMIAGNKTQFRELIKPQPEEKLKNYFYSQNETTGYCESLFILDKCHYQVGQKIFCKESFEIWDDGLVYKSDNSPANIVSKWTPAQHMKQEHSRLTLQIKEIRVERLSEISEEDAIAEGIEEVTIPIFENIQPKIKSWKWYEKDNFGTYSAIKSFGNLWSSTHKKPEEKFEANPWVFVYQFEIIK
jgi:hypothetical protein